MRHARVIWSIFFSLVLTPVICHGQASVTLSPTSLTFSGQLLNTIGLGKAITLTNSGSAGLTITSITASGNFGASSNCPISPSTLAAAAHCTITATFKPSTSGSVSGEVTILDSAGGSPHLVTLSGTGLTAISLSPTSLIFGTIAVGTTSAAKTVTLTNNLSTALTIGFSASGDYAAIGSGATPCGSSLAGKTKCTMSVTFKPKSNGSINGAVTITYNSSFSPQEVALSGSGSGGSSSPLTFSPTSLTFTNQLVGTKSTSKTVTVTNSTALSLSISKIAASGNFAAAGSGATPCGGSLAAGAKCTMAVSFSPTINGVIKGAVAITDSTTVSPQVYNLSGTGVLPLGFSPPSITFAARTVGTTSPPMTVTLTNNQSTALTLSLAASGEFKAAPSGTVPCGSSLAAMAKCTFIVTFTPAAGGTINGVVTAAYTGGPYSPLEVKLTGTGQDFKLSASSLTVGRGTSGNTQVTVSSLGGFTGTVSVSVTNPPSGITASPVNISAGNTSPLTLNVTSSTGPGPFTLSLKGTSGSLTHTATLTLNVPLGGGVNTLVPRTSGTNAFPSTAVPYITKLIADFTPVQLQECGSASAAHTIAVVYNPAQGFSNFDENNLVINVDFLPSPNANGVDQFFDHNLVHEASHALQADILKIVNGVNRRGTTADTEGFAQACADRVARDMALAGTRPDELDSGSLSVLWLDTLERINPAAVAAGVWSNSAAHAQPMLTLGEGSYLLAASQTGAHGGGGMVEHENALFAADSVTTSPLSAAQRRQIWDATGITLDAKSAGAWMPTDMIQAPTLIAGQTFLYAWPVNPQFPAQMMAQALVVQSNDPATQPVVLAIASGPLTITVRDIHGQVVLAPISADFADTSGIANYVLGLQDKVAQGAYTVSVKATVNGKALESHFAVAVIPRSLTGVDTPASFPGQYIIAVDAAGNANGGTLTVTRGTVVPIVPAIPGFRIVNPDSSGTFDVIGPSGIERTYTAPTTAPAPWARFILVE